jgi:hypothetical protein
MSRGQPVKDLQSEALAARLARQVVMFVRWRILSWRKAETYALPSLPKHPSFLLAI